MLKKKILNISVLNWLLIVLIIIISFLRKTKEEFTTENKAIESEKPKNKKNKNIKVYNFNTLWCGYSRQFQPAFDEFKRKMNQMMLKL